jgi:hypothetical protein
MKYVLLIIYLSTSGHSWETTKYREAFDSMKECESRHITWKLSLKTQYISGQCYYQGNKPLPGDCKAWGEYSRKWTSYCTLKGNEITKRCVDLETPPAPYNQCQ